MRQKEEAKKTKEETTTMLTILIYNFKIRKHNQNTLFFGYRLFGVYKNLILTKDRTNAEMVVC